MAEGDVRRGGFAECGVAPAPASRCAPSATERARAVSLAHRDGASRDVIRAALRRQAPLGLTARTANIGANSPGARAAFRVARAFHGLGVFLALSVFGMCGLLAMAAPAAARHAAFAARTGTVPMPAPTLPGASLVPLAFDDLDGWGEDDLAAAFATFRLSCRASFSVSGALPRESGPPGAPLLRRGLAQACAAAAALGAVEPTIEVARLFFEANFRPYQVIPTDRPDAFFTGYYEPEVEGALTPGQGFDVPVYARPPDLVMAAGPKANGGGASRREGDRLVPYYDRTQIEEGALAGRGLEIVYLKDPVDLFFMQIQGSARVRLPDGRILRLNYDGYNGFPYTPVGRLLIQRGLVPREDMSMERIRAYMEQDPEAGRALRRENQAFVFFKALELSADEGPMGAEGVPLTAGRSLAVDHKLHSYGSPVFVEALLPLSGPRSGEPFRHLMIAQDTGSAIVGPARADLYFGAGAEAGAVAGRIRHTGRFTLLVPRFIARDPR